MKILRKILSRLRGEQNIDKLIKRGLKVGKNSTKLKLATKKMLKATLIIVLFGKLPNISAKNSVLV